MADNCSVKGTVSKRSARVYSEENEVSVELSSVVQGQSSCSSESRCSSGDERADLEKKSRKRHRSLSGIGSGYEDGIIRVVDLGIDLRGLFPNTAEAIGEQVAKSLQTANGKIEGRPRNFGAIVPGAIYRSSFPLVEDHAFLESLDLKTVVTLVDKEYPPEFKPFLKENGIRHFIIDMKGTKKVPISEYIMHSILEIALDRSNHPVLIHCNHGKHRTGCAAAVIRQIAGWNISDIVEEYSMFADDKIREVDIKYITEYEATLLEGLFLRQRQQNRAFLIDEKMVRYLLGGIFLVLLCVVITLFLRH